MPRERPPVLEDQTLAPKGQWERSTCQLQDLRIAELRACAVDSTVPANAIATDVVNVNAGALR